MQQVLQQHAIEIAKTYTVNKDRWTKAARNIRNPYWDWAVHAVPPPEVSWLEQVTITKPDGSKGKVPNPLVKYTFHPIDSSFPLPWSDWPTTLRHPVPTSGPNAKSDVKAMERSAISYVKESSFLTWSRSNLRAEFQSTRSSLYAMFYGVHNWSDFSNHTAAPGKNIANSLEAIHDNIHECVCRFLSFLLL